MQCGCRRHGRAARATVRPAVSGLSELMPEVAGAMAARLDASFGVLSSEPASCVCVCACGGLLGVGVGRLVWCVTWVVLAGEPPFLMIPALHVCLLCCAVIQ